MIKPRKSLGQNFLKSKAVAERIVAQLEPAAGDVILEIGPGTGVLTEPLFQSGAQVYAVEVDRRLAHFLSEKYACAANLCVLEADILELDWDRLPHQGKLKVIGNLPYHITAPVLQTLFDQHERVRLAVLTVQKEVAARIAAPVGASDYSSLTLLVNNYCTARRLFDLSARQFHPPPEVTSTVVRLDFRPTPYIDNASYARLRELTRHAFSQRRKMVVNSLMRAEAIGRDQAENLLQAAGIDKTSRPQNLSLEQFARLADIVQRQGK